MHIHIIALCDNVIFFFILIDLRIINRAYLSSVNCYLKHFDQFLNNFTIKLCTELKSCTIESNIEQNNKNHGLSDWKMVTVKYSFYLYT